jgi:hypothetical protein
MNTVPYTEAASQEPTRRWSWGERRPEPGDAGGPAADPYRQQVVDCLRLFLEPGQVWELRALKVAQRFGRTRTMAGYFDTDHAEEAAQDALDLTDNASGVYFTLNPLKPAVLARRAYRVDLAEEGELAKNGDVERRRWLYIDVDGTPSAGVSATDVEKTRAQEVALAVREHLRGRGWPEPIYADSGNGYHLLYRVELPADDGGLLQRVLEVLGQRFTAGGVKIDQTVHNAGRICKLYGTLARKGDSVGERMHRRAAILETPSPLVPVSHELLEALAAAAAAPATAVVADEATTKGQPPQTPTQTSPPKTPDAARAKSPVTQRSLLLVEEWLKERGVEYRVKAGDPWTVYHLAECPFDPSHRAPDAAIMQSKDGALAFKCHHDSCRAKKWKECKAKIGAPEAHHYDPPRKTRGAATSDGRRRVPAASLLVNLALAAGLELLRQGDGRTYAAIPVDGHRETISINSGSFRAWLHDLYRREFGHGAGGGTLADAVGDLGDRALRDGRRVETQVRVGGHDQRVYLDLGDASWRAVEIDADGWRLVDRPPVYFRRGAGMAALPEPVQGGSLDELRALINVHSDAAWRLLIAWLGGALYWRGPYPPLVLGGEQGTAKSMTARLLMGLLDPPTPQPEHVLGEPGMPPRDLGDLMLSARNRRIVTLDNLSSLPTWLSDAICCLSTGASMGKRKLWTDDEEALFALSRPVILASINDVVRASDLSDRSLILRFEPIPPWARLAEAELERRFTAARPRIMGALFDALSGGLKLLPSLRLPQLPRMADFALLGEAVWQGLGQPAGTIISALEGNREDADEVVLAEAPIVVPLLEMMRHAAVQADETLGETVEVRQWSGEARDLLDRLNRIRRETERSNYSGFGSPGQGAVTPLVDRPAKTWPANPIQLGGQLRHIAPALRRRGIEVCFTAPSKKTNGRRIITITGTRRLEEAAAST